VLAEESIADVGVDAPTPLALEAAAPEPADAVVEAAAPEPGAPDSPHAASIVDAAAQRSIWRI
jgi:hypothetical protein